MRRREVYLAEGFLMVTGDLVQAAGRAPTIEATKTKYRRRRIDLPPIALDALRERMKRCFAEGSGELVFTTISGKPIHDDNLRHRWWKPLIEKAAALAEKDARAAGDATYRFPANFRMYDLRHTANALMGLSGCRSRSRVNDAGMARSNLRQTHTGTFTRACSATSPLSWRRCLTRFGARQRDGRDRVAPSVASRGQRGV